MTTSAPLSPFVLLWRNLGPYHVARSRAAAEHFAAHDIPLAVIELSSGERTRDWEVDRKALPFRLHTLASSGMLTKRTPSMARALCRLLDEMQPLGVAVAGYDRPEMRAAMRWGRTHHRSVILMSETKWDDRPRPRWKQWGIRHQVSRANAALVSGTASAEFMQAMGMPATRIFQPYGVVDNKYFKTRAAQTTDDAQSPRYFLAVTRLIEERKNVQTLLNAYRQYRATATGAPWELVVCGDGPDRARLESLVRRESLEGVRFVGFQQIDALAGYYARASCFVHTAVKEAWGLVVNEAMASGLPVLVSRRCGCARDLVLAGRNGYTFDPDRTEEIAGAMTRIADMTETERCTMGEASSQHIHAWRPECFAQALWDAWQAARPS